MRPVLRALRCTRGIATLSPAGQGCARAAAPGSAQEPLPARSGAGRELDAILAPCTASAAPDTAGAEAAPPHGSPPSAPRRYVRLSVFVSSNSCVLQPRAAPAPAFSRRSSTAATKQGSICSDPHSRSARRCKTHQRHLPLAR